MAIAIVQPASSAVIKLVEVVADNYPSPVEDTSHFVIQGCAELPEGAQDLQLTEGVAYPLALVATLCRQHNGNALTETYGG